MKLHVIDISPNSRITLATALHLNLDVDIIKEDITAGDLEKADFMALNPNGMVPLLEHDDFSLWESRAIVQYFSSLSDATNFYPADARGRNDIHRWQFWEALHYNKAVGAVCWETVAKPAFGMGEADDDIVRNALVDFNQFATVLDQQLKGKSFILGEELTLADFSVGSHAGLIRVEHSRIPLGQYPNISAWLHRLDTIDAWAKTEPVFER